MAHAGAGAVAEHQQPAGVSGRQSRPDTLLLAAVATNESGSAWIARWVAIMASGSDRGAIIAPA